MKVRKLILAFLLTTYVVSSALFIVVFKTFELACSVSAAYRIKYQLEESNIVKLTFAPASDIKEVIWKNDHEFMYRNSLYDIIEKKETGGAVHFYCIKDENENVLVEIFNFFYKERGELQHLLAKIFSTFDNLNPSTVPQQYDNRYCVETLGRASHTAMQLFETIIEIPDPPPNLIV